MPTRSTSPPPHGTHRRYLHRSHPCRCRDCRAAHAAYMAAYRARGGGRARWVQLTIYDVLEAAEAS